MSEMKYGEARLQIPTAITVRLYIYVRSVLLNYSLSKYSLADYAMPCAMHGATLRKQQTRW